MFNVENIHTRVVDQPKHLIAALFDTLSTENDLVWPQEKWPPMRFNDGLKLGSKGGHGPVRYTVTRYDPGHIVEFTFSKPRGIVGVHGFEIKAVDADRTKITHYIRTKLEGIGILTWYLAIRWLHDALLEDAMDKIENQFSDVHKRTEWSPWVKYLRKLLGDTKSKLPNQLSESS